MEHILVIRRSLFDELGAFQGLTFDVERYLPTFLRRENNFFLPREEAEKDPTHKQLIPYALLTYRGRVLSYRRGKGGGEARLASKRSIGFGGHLNPLDQEHLDGGAYESLVLRELGEELHLGTAYTNRVVALLNDDSTEVGQVHLGLVHHIKLEQPTVSSGESEIQSLGFEDPAKLRLAEEEFETWSRICLADLERLLR